MTSRTSTKLMCRVEITHSYSFTAPALRRCSSESVSCWPSGVHCLHGCPPEQRDQCCARLVAIQLCSANVFRVTIHGPMSIAWRYLLIFSRVVCQGMPCTSEKYSRIVFALTPLTSASRGSGCCGTQLLYVLLRSSASRVS